VKCNAIKNANGLFCKKTSILLNAESAKETEFSGHYDMLINEKEITIRTVFVKFQQVGWTSMTSNSNRGCRESQ